MHGHGGVAEQRLWPRCGDGDKLRIALLPSGVLHHGVFEVPEMALHRLLEHLVVADGGLKKSVPIHQPLTAVDLAVLEQAEERLTDRAGALLIEREPQPLPVAARAELL